MDEINVSIYKDRNEEFVIFLPIDSGYLRIIDNHESNSRKVFENLCHQFFDHLLG